MLILICPDTPSFIRPWTTYTPIPTAPITLFPDVSPSPSTLGTASGRFSMFSNHQTATIANMSRSHPNTRNYSSSLGGRLDLPGEDRVNSPDCGEHVLYADYAPDLDYYSRLTPKPA